MTESLLNLLGMGIYTKAEAARLLGLSTARISSWLRGYRYSWGPRGGRRRGSQPPVLKTDIPSFDGSLSISFLELMELRVVKEFRDQKVPLQTVRLAWRNAAQAYGTHHPFADERVFLDGKRIILAPEADLSSNVLEVSSRKAPFQLVAGPIFQRSLRMFEFDERTHLAREWWPQGRSTPVVLNPRVAFGAPVVADTRVPTRVLAFFAKTNPIEAVADLFDLSANRVRAAMQYENWLARAA